MYSFNKVTGIAPVLLSVVSLPVMADNLGDIERIYVKGAKITGTKNIVTSDIMRKQAIDLEDLLRDQSNITVGGSFGAAQKIYIRGIEDTNINITVDGAAQTGQLFHHQSRLSIEPELLKRVEIKAGAGTALDGFGALGGAIHFSTKDVQDLLDADRDFGALVKLGATSNTSGNNISANLFGNLNSSVSAMAVFGKKEGDELEDGRGHKAENTNYDQEIGLLKVESRLNENSSFKVSHEYRRDNGRRNLRVHFKSAPWNQASKQESERTTSTVNYSFDDPDDLMDLSITGYQTENRFSYGDLDSPMSDAISIESIGIDVRNSMQILEHDITLGVQYRENTNKRKNSPQNESDDAYAVYLQDSTALLERVLVSYGLRYDHYSYDDAFRQRFSDSGFSPNVNIEYTADEYWQFRFGYSQAIRGQSTKQAMMIGNVKNDALLTAEKANNKELSVIYQRNGYEVSATVFSTKIKDVVTANGNPMDGFQYENSGLLATDGYEVVLAKSWSMGRAQLTYSSNEPEINGEPLSDSHFGLGTSYGDTLTLSASHQLTTFDGEIGWSSRLVKDMKRTPEGYPVKEGFDTHDIYIEWYPSVSQNLTVNATVHNIFDEYFYDHGTFGYSPENKSQLGIPEAGRDIRLTLSWRF